MTWGPLLVPQQFFPLLVTVTLHPSFSTILRTQQRRPILLELCSCNKRLGLQTGILGERKSQWLMFHWKYTRQVLLIKINLLLHKPAALALVSLPLIETRSHKTRGGGGGESLASYRLWSQQTWAADNILQVDGLTRVFWFKATNIESRDYVTAFRNSNPMVQKITFQLESVEVFNPLSPCQHHTTIYSRNGRPGTVFSKTASAFG